MAPGDCGVEAGVPHKPPRSPIVCSRFEKRRQAAALHNPVTGAAGGPTTTSTFDLDGDQLSLTDPDGNTTSWSYDCLGEAIGQSESWRWATTRRA